MNPDITLPKTKFMQVYTGALSQAGSAAPLLYPEPTQNTIGTITWTRLGAGSYRATSAGLFTPNKTLVYMGPPNFVDNQFEVNHIDENTINVISYAAGIPADNIIQSVAFRIEIYN